MKKKNRRLRIGWSSNVPWGFSGYATQTNAIVPRLKEAGFPIAVNAFAGFMGGFFNVNEEWQLKGRWADIPIYPTLNHAYGSDGLWKNLQEHWNADIVIPFQDIFTLHESDTSKLNRMVPYMPIDRTPVPPPVLNSVRQAWRIITYSKWGHDELMKKGYASEYIPHGIDVNIWKPLDKGAARIKYGIGPETFVFGMIAANKENPPRKGFQHALDAFKRFLDNHPDSIMWFHVDVNREGGFPIKGYAEHLGIGSKIRFIDPLDMLYYDSPMLNELVNVFDCLLAPSYSEGFGLPIIEAQGAGVPVIVNDFSAMTELVKDGETGFLTKPSMARFDQQGAYHREVDGEHLYENMEKMFNADRQKMSKEARKWASSEYNIDSIVRNKWVPFLERIEEEIYGPEPKETLDDAMEASLAQVKEQFGDAVVKEDQKVLK